MTVWDRQKQMAMLTFRSSSVVGFAFRLRLSLMDCSNAAVLVTMIAVIPGRMKCSKVFLRYDRSYAGRL